MVEPSGKLDVAVPKNIGIALDRVFERFSNADLYYGHGTDNAWDEAVFLVLDACGLPLDSGDDALEATVTEPQWQTMVQGVRRRVEDRVPLPYILGRAWFAGIEFRCDERALVPRSPIAELVQAHFDPWYGGTEALAQPRTLLDLCCGGGCIGIAAALHMPSLEVVLADIDSKALDLARENIALHQLQARVSCVESDLFQSLAPGQFDIVVTNPPYVDASDIASMPAEYQAEPPLGLGSGVDGLDATRLIFERAEEFLAPGGLLVIELGNSWVALDRALSALELTWVEFANGGDGVLIAQREQLADIRRTLSESPHSP